MSNVRKSPRRYLPAIILLIALLPLWACGGSGDSGSPTAPGVPMSDAQIEFTSFDLVNQARLQHQVDQLLSLEDRISEVARSHSEAMRDEGFFGHRDPDGSGLRARLREAGIRFRKAGENLAQVENAGDPATYAHTQLMNSDSHRSNILDDDYVVMGVGVARIGTSYWITQIFVLP